MGVIIFNSISSEHYGILVEHPPNYETPEKDYEIVHVPGKNGDVIIDKKSYKNVPRTYNIAVSSPTKSFQYKANDVIRWLHSASGYARLEDSYEPDYYRLAMFKDAGVIENILGNAGRTTIAFDCKPQRFLKTGDQSVTINAVTELINPTGFEALPIITVFGSGAGVLGIGGYTVTISAINVSLVINSEIGDAYKGALNKNSTITLSAGFPTLSAGSNEISFSGGITSVAIIPRWWTL